MKSCNFLGFHSSIIHFTKLTLQYTSTLPGNNPKQSDKEQGVAIDFIITVSQYSVFAFGI